MSIELSATNGVGTATFNRPEAMNSMTAKILTEWQAGIRELADNPEVKVIVVTGKGRAFSAGLDLSKVSTAATTRRGATKPIRRLAYPRPCAMEPTSSVPWPASPSRPSLPSTGIR